MKILFLGDSITEGVGASSSDSCYVNLVKKELCCEVVNYGVSGTRIARQRIKDKVSFFDWDFLQRAKIMDKDADKVFVFGGTNDYGHGNAPMGEFGNKDEYTFIGGLELLVEYLISTYGKEKICAILPLPRFQSESVVGDNGLKKEWGIEGYPLSEYVENSKKIYEKYGLDYLDLSSVLSQPMTNENAGFFIDGLHPNDKGHKAIADSICKYVKRNSV